MNKMGKIKKRVILLLLPVAILFSCAKSEIDDNQINENGNFTETEIKEYLTITPGLYRDMHKNTTTLKVEYKNKNYYFEVTIKDSEFEETKIIFSGEFNITENGVVYNNSKSAILEYEKDINSSTSNARKLKETYEVYEEGTGIIKLDGKRLYWIDNQEVAEGDSEYNGIFDMMVTGFTGTENGSITNNYYYGANMYPYFNGVYPYYNGAYPYNYNPYGSGYYPYNNFGYGANGFYTIPANSYYYISGYSNNGGTIYNQQVMNTRFPIISGNYQNLVNMANGLIISAYKSIMSWCSDNVMTANVQNFFLNSAFIESQTPDTIVLIVNCALQKKSVIDKDKHEFRLTLNLRNNRFRWYKIGANDGNGRKKIFEYDPSTGEIIVIYE